MFRCLRLATAPTIALYLLGTLASAEIPPWPGEPGPGQFRPVEEQVNLLENGNFSRAVGGKPVGWTLEGPGKPYIFNRGMYHAAGIEVTDRKAPGAALVSRPIPVSRPGTYVLCGLVSGGAGEDDEVIPTDVAKEGCGFIEVRAFDAKGKRLADATRFTFQGKRRDLGTKLYRQRDRNWGWIFRRFNLPKRVAKANIAFGLEKAIGRTTADSLVLYREIEQAEHPLPVAAADADLTGWKKSFVLTDGVRTPGSPADVHPILVGVWKYPQNRYLIADTSKGALFDLGVPCAIDGIEVSMAVSVRDQVDMRVERWEPSILTASWSDDGVNFGPGVQLLYRPALMKTMSLVSARYRGFRRVGRYVKITGNNAMTEVRFFGKSRGNIVLGHRPVVKLRDGLLAYGTEIQMAGIDDQSFKPRVPKGNVTRIVRDRYADVAFSSQAGRVAGKVVFSDFEPDTTVRREFLAPDAAALAESGASLEIAYHDQVDVWDSPTTRSFRTDQKLPPVQWTGAVPALPALPEVNAELAALKKELQALSDERRGQAVAIASAKLTPRLIALGVEETEVKTFFEPLGGPKTLGPDLLPVVEALSEDGKYRYAATAKARDVFLFGKYDAKTGRYFPVPYHRGTYLVRGEVAQVVFNSRASLQRPVAEGETFEQALASADGWKPMGVTMRLNRGFRAVYRLPFDLPAGGTWTMCYKTLWGFPESRMFLNGKELGTPFRWNQHVIRLEDCREGRNELVIFGDASKAKINLELKPFSTSFYHLFWLRTAGPVTPISNQAIIESPATITLIYGGHRQVIKLPKVEAEPAAVQFASLFKPTSTTGIITTRASDGDYMTADGKRFFTWGGHWNHVHSKASTDAAAKYLPQMGVSSVRHIFGSESELDNATGKWKPEALDDVLYQFAKLGEAGVYVCPCLHSYSWYRDPGGAFYMAENGRDPRGRPISRLWNPVYLRAQKNYATELLTTVSPYTGRKLVDDPTMIAIEIANEDYKIGGRGFDFEQLAEPERTIVRKRWNEWLLRKYRTQGKLAEAWALEPLQDNEDPRRGTIHFPPQFKTVRVSPNFFHDWDAESRAASPRVSDALEWTYTEIHNFIRIMHDHLRSLGVKCSISWCGFSTIEIQMTNIHPYISICDSLGGSAYGNNTNFRSLERWYRHSSMNHFYGKSSHVREWSSYNVGSDVATSSNGLLAAGLFGLAHGTDQWSHHKLGGGLYPSLEQEAIRSINPDFDNRRATFSFVGWAHRRASIPVQRPDVLIGVPKAEACYGGLNSPCDTQPLKGGYTFLYDQAHAAYYAFDEVYDGPRDLVVMHEGRSPTGDYRKAGHVVLWSHGKTDPAGRDEEARKKWFALHGVQFAPGERWKKADLPLPDGSGAAGKVLAFNCDLVDDPELNAVVYDTLAEWGVKLPYTRDEIHKVYANADRSIEVDVRLARMKVDRDDFQAWMGRNQGERTTTSRLNIGASSDQVQVIALPFDAGSFETAQQITLWSRTDATVRLKATFPKEPEVWAVNWVGTHKQRVYPLAWDQDSVTIRFKKDLDVHFYEILK